MASESPVKDAEYWVQNYMHIPLDYQNIPSLEKLKEWLVKLLKKDPNQAVTLGVRVATSLDADFFRNYIGTLFPPEVYPTLMRLATEYPGNYPYSILKAIAKTGLYKLPSEGEAQKDFDEILLQMRGGSDDFPINEVGLLQYLVLDFPNVRLDFNLHSRRGTYGYQPTLNQTSNPYVAEFVKWYNNEYPLLFKLEGRGKQVKSSTDLPIELINALNEYQGLSSPFRIVQRRKLEEATGLSPDLVNIVQQFQ